MLSHYMIKCILNNLKWGVFLFEDTFEKEQKHFDMILNSFKVQY